MLQPLHRSPVLSPWWRGTLRRSRGKQRGRESNRNSQLHWNVKVCRELASASGCCVFMWCINSKNDLRLCAEHAVKLRLELIKAHALRTVSSLQQKAEQTYGNMEEWLGARFLSEMNRWEEDRWMRDQRSGEDVRTLYWLSWLQLSCRHQFK